MSGSRAWRMASIAASVAAEHWQLGARFGQDIRYRARQSLLVRLDARIWGRRAKARSRKPGKVGQEVPLMYSLYFTSYAPSSIVESTKQRMCSTIRSLPLATEKNRTLMRKA